MRFYPVKKETNMVKSWKVIFENRKNCSPSELHGGSLFRTFNSYSFNFNGGLRTRRTCFCLLRTPSPRGEQFLWFISSLTEVNFYFIYMCLLRTNLPNLCPNMIHVDALDFSECHSEEVISFFWRSVYRAQFGSDVRGNGEKQLFVIRKIYFRCICIDNILIRYSFMNITNYSVFAKFTYWQ